MVLPTTNSLFGCTFRKYCTDFQVLRKILIHVFCDFAETSDIIYTHNSVQKNQVHETITFKDRVRRSGCAFCMSHQNVDIFLYNIIGHDL